MPTTPVEHLVQLPSLDEMIELFELDATSLGGDIYRFTPMAFSDAEVIWDGHVFSPVPIQTSGWETSGSGTLPTPHIQVANVNLQFSAIAIAYDDLLGAVLTRHRTFRRYLDGQPDADPTVELEPVDVYRINQKVAQNKIFIEWELAAVIDQEGRLLPGRAVLQAACPFRYRIWTGAAFDYTHAACPYTGTAYFDVNGNPVATPDLDVPGKRVSTCCRKRFPTGDLPFGGFPGAGRIH